MAEIGECGRWRLKIHFVRDLSQYMAFCRVEGGEEMSRERGILPGSFLLREGKSERKVGPSVWLLIAQQDGVVL